VRLRAWVDPVSAVRHTGGSPSDAFLWNAGPSHPIACADPPANHTFGSGSVWRNHHGRSAAWSHGGLARPPAVNFPTLSASKLRPGPVQRPRLGSPNSTSVLGAGRATNHGGQHRGEPRSRRAGLPLFASSRLRPRPHASDDRNQRALSALGKQPAAHFPSPCSAGYPGRSRKWLRPCHFRQRPCRNQRRLFPVVGAQQPPPRNNNVQGEVG
jgi:hypothetical protein